MKWRVSASPVLNFIFPSALFCLSANILKSFNRACFSPHQWIPVILLPAEKPQWEMLIVQTKSTVLFIFKKEFD